MKDVFYEELDCVSNKFPKYHTKIVLRDFNAKVGKKKFRAADFDSRDHTDFIWRGSISRR
jgi:hypothetical protein